MTLIGYIFRKLENAKDVVSSISRQRHFRTPCESQHVKQSLTSYCLIALATSELENVALSVSETLRVFVNTLTADEKYYLCNRKKFQNQFNCNYVRNKKIFLNFLPDI